MCKSILFLTLAFSMSLLFSCQSKQNLVNEKSGQSKGIVMMPDVYPVFTQGNVTRWLDQRLRYPAAERRNGITGRVYVSFVINKKGQVVNPHVAQSSGNSKLDAEALRVISELPEWLPARLKGKKVATLFTQPVTFSLER